MAIQMDATVSFDQFCPVAVSLDALGDRWAVLLMRDLLWAGPQSRVGLLERNPGRDEETLSSALDRLRAHDLVQQLDEPKRRYNLTEKGEGIGDVIRALFNFGMPLLGDVVVNDWMLAYSIADCSRRKRFDLLEVEERVLV
jgi:DNA-binding HxlR family transcriptional regulator